MKKKKLKILYEDKYIIVVDKPAGMLTISNDKDRINTLYHEVHEYLKSKNTKVFIVHRLDRDTSGLVLFAKSEKIKNIFQNDWDNVIRKYLTIVNGIVKEESGVIKSYLKETNTLLVYSTNDKKNGKLAITEYKKLAVKNNYTLLDINIKTGRKNQIRVHLNDINHPIVGDKKYSKIKNANIKRLCLHAYYLEFIHPISKEIIKINSDIPLVYKDYFNKFLSKGNWSLINNESSSLIEK